MANHRYASGLKALADADIDLLVDTISMQMYENDGVLNTADVFLSDVVGTKAGAPVDLAGKATTGGIFTLSLAVPSFTPPGSVTIGSVVLYKNTGVDATSRLIGWIDQRADGTPLAILTTGGIVNLNWSGPVFSIGGT